MIRDKACQQIKHIDVAVGVPLRQSFSYSFTGDPPKRGVRVLVPFGKRKLVGVVIAQGTQQPESYKLKPVLSVLDVKPIFSEHLIKLIEWTARYYHHPIGETWRAAIPQALRKGLEETHGLTEKHYVLADLPDDWRQSVSRAPLQTKLVETLTQHKCEISQAELFNLVPNARNALVSLSKKNWVFASHRRPKINKVLPTQAAHTLSDEQQKAFERLAQDSNAFECRLLEGVTGSGKTEIYFRLIDLAIKEDRQALVLLPEIALTDQHFARFTERFGSRVAQIHSGMNDTSRYQIWSQARSGEIDIVLTTRSGVFVEFNALGLIIVDEEHDLSYKQHEGLRYHARSVAIKRAQFEQIPIVLGSATPALETLVNVKRERYLKATLARRVGARSLPKIELLDLNTHKVQSGLSQPAIEAIKQTLDRKQQALVFINRRGYAPVLFCTSCQWTAKCKRCDAQMTTHQSRRALQCHHCGAHRAFPQACDDCGKTELLQLGEGTQKIEQVLTGLFPAARIQRFDRDVLSSASKLKQAMDKVHAEEIDILVGTQLLSKGHDFSAVDLVVVINADQGLHSIDFRAPEQLVQQLVQVAGRAGRDKQPGRVLIQTCLASHPALQAVRQHDYGQFAVKELEIRRLAQFPPFTYIALWRVSGYDQNDLMHWLHQLAEEGQALQPEGTLCYDPVKSPMFKRGGKFHGQLLISANQRKQLHQWLDIWIKRVEKMKVSSTMKWSIDVDPMSLF